MKENLPEMHNVAIAAVASFGEPAIIRLHDLLKSEDKKTRIVAAICLGSIPDDRVIQPLIEALQDDYSAVRNWAVVGLGNRGNPDALPFLSEAEFDPDEKVRQEVAKAIEKLQNRD